MRLTNREKNNSDTFLDTIIIQLLAKKQEGKCESCGANLNRYQIHHKRYAENITLKDLVLLCGICHARISGRRTIAGKTRKFVKVEARLEKQKNETKIHNSK